MDYIEVTGKTVEDARTEALIKLGTTSDQIEVEILEKGSSGFLGIGSKPAIIKARKVEESSEEKEIEKIVDSVKIDAFKEETAKEAETTSSK